jgi:hypothetical protein
MLLLLGQPDDTCLLAVEAALRERGRAGAIMSSPFARPGRASWSFPASSGCHIMLRTGSRPIPVEGVLCRGIGLSAAPSSDGPGWTMEDLAYMRAEADAALLGWLSGVPCRVVDRLPAWLCYNVRPAVLGWAMTLAECGLPPLDAVTTDDSAAITALLEAPGAGAAWVPFTGAGARYMAGAASLPGLTETARLTPLHLSALHDGAWRACVLGARDVVWDDATPHNATALDPLLRRFAAAVALDAVELVMTAAPPGLARTVEVSARPNFEAFGPVARVKIAAGLAKLLCDEIVS